jgi:hypothetical protein
MMAVMMAMALSDDVRTRVLLLGSHNAVEAKMEIQSTQATTTKQQKPCHVSCSEDDAPPCPQILLVRNSLLE